jgi:hypothetical protein
MKYKLTADIINYKKAIIVGGLGHEEKQMEIEDQIKFDTATDTKDKYKVKQSSQL